MGTHQGWDRRLRGSWEAGRQASWHRGSRRSVPKSVDSGEAWLHHNDLTSPSKQRLLREAFHPPCPGRVSTAPAPRQAGSPLLQVLLPGQTALGPMPAAPFTSNAAPPSAAPGWATSSLWWGQEARASISWHLAVCRTSAGGLRMADDTLSTRGRGGHWCSQPGPRGTGQGRASRVSQSSQGGRGG